MFVTNTFAWHVGAVALFSLAVGFSVYKSERPKIPCCGSKKETNMHVQFSRCVKMANGNEPLPSSKSRKSAGNHEYKPVSAKNGGSIVLEFSDEDDDDDDLEFGVVS